MLLPAMVDLYYNRLHYCQPAGNLQLVDISLKYQEQRGPSLTIGRLDFCGIKKIKMFYLRKIKSDAQL